jgi:hypothetical protein
MRLRTGNNHSDALRKRRVFPQFILFRNPMIKTGRDSVALCSLVDSHGDKGIYRTEQGTTLSNVPYHIAKRDAYDENSTVCTSWSCNMDTMPNDIDDWTPVAYTTYTIVNGVFAGKPLRFCDACIPISREEREFIMKQGV